MIGFARTAAILTAISLGALIPQAHVLSVAIRWLVVMMLFIVFLQVRLSRSALHPRHFFLLAANISLGFAGWGAGWLTGVRAAQSRRAAQTSAMMSTLQELAQTHPFLVGLGASAVAGAGGS